MKVFCQYLGAWILSVAAVWSFISGYTLLVETSRHEVAHMRVALIPYIVTAGVCLAVWIVTAYVDITRSKDASGDLSLRVLQWSIAGSAR
jgi:hypothetical protein